MGLTLINNVASLDNILQKIEAAHPAAQVYALFLQRIMKSVFEGLMNVPGHGITRS